MSHVYDCLRLLLVALVSPVAFAPAVFAGHLAFERWGLLGVVLTVPVLAYLGVFLFLLLCAVLCRIFVGRLEPAVIKAGSAAHLRWGVYTLFHSFALGELKPFLSTYFTMQRLYFRLMGAKIGKNVTFAPYVTLLEPCLLEVGDGATIGNSTTLATHIGTKDGSMLLGPIHIGKRAVVGGLSTLLPGVVVGDDAQIGAFNTVFADVVLETGASTGPCNTIRSGCSVGERAVTAFGSHLARNARVLEGERWGGTPARRLAEPSEGRVSRETE